MDGIGANHGLHLEEAGLAQPSGSAYTFQKAGWVDETAQLKFCNEVLVLWCDKRFGLKSPVLLVADACGKFRKTRSTKMALGNVQRLRRLCTKVKG